ncbi:hypothetical protein JCM9140_2274 [Halalkalibacter wakoensis JCM 9140]|uniref:Uncharacterized protein n=1 Tax=Halalkalibacter wakoensis JCM 9140 TaxID=1236970 RepID=W4Q2R2_9BACI|nr:hypothetical protein [Halalkalibacter wakoensis]GAE26235.1 hypothetical protein JCM9140_2274 [Halalkalibacter wakoensis JCM 9140]
MNLIRIWVCTSKNANLNRIYSLQTGKDERTAIYKCFESDLNNKSDSDSYLEKLNGDALIDDIPYYIIFDDIDTNSYLHPFKEKINEIINPNSPSVIQFSKSPLKQGEIKNLEEDEGIKFIIAQSNDELFFLHASNHAIIKNKLILNFDINENSSVLTVPKGIQVPSAITAKLNWATKKLFVYDVNKFESMLTLNENQKAKSQATLNKFNTGEYKISSDQYIFKGLGSQDVQQKLQMSKRAIRRLAKYQPSENNYPIEKIKEAVERLDPSLHVNFNDTTKEIIISPDTAKTFVGIIHNSIIERLISGDVEITV